MQKSTWTLPRLGGKKLSVVLFILEEEIDAIAADLQKEGNRKDVQLVVQPSPYEGVEFLCRIELDETDFEQCFADQSKFWHIVSCDENLSENVFQKLCQAHYDFLACLLAQDLAGAKKHRTTLQKCIKS